MNMIGVARVFRSLPRLFGRALVQLYRHTLSPLIGVTCRHLPSCSEYSDEALARHGLWAGCWMTLARLCRCHPGGTSGLDFVPLAPPVGARWWLPWRYGRWRGTQASPPQRAAPAKQST
jgi:putative membrane protein insertion efficiency factor